MIERTTVYIYALINPLNQEVFYIGATVDPYMRLRQHICEMNYAGSYKAKVIDKLVCEHGIDPELLILDTTSFNDAAYWENFYIGYYKFLGFYLPQIKQTYTYTGIPRFKNKEYLIPNPKNKLIDGKDIHYYRREVFKKFKFYQHT